jgi:peptide/nickel transport system permease protein
MLNYLVRRFGQIIPTLFFVSIMIFGLQQLLPGDPALALAGEERDELVIAQLRAQYNLDKPIPVQYWYWLKGVFQGDLGESIRIKQPVAELIMQKLPVTAQLAFWSMLIAILIGVPAGILSAVHKNTWLDYVANGVGLSGLSIPNFWLGIMLILIFAVQLGWLPAGGYVEPADSLLGNLERMLLPAFVLGTNVAAVLMRHTRSAMLSVLKADYVRTARAKGLAEKIVILHHALRNALVPVITLGAIQMGELMGGAVLTEQIFNIPGFGKLIVDAVFNRDYAVVQGVVLFTAGVYIVLNLCADIAYALVNPRLRA